MCSIAPANGPSLNRKTTNRFIPPSKSASSNGCARSNNGELALKTDDPEKQLAAALGRITSGLYVMTLTRDNVETGMLVELGAAMFVQAAPDQRGPQS